MTTSWVGGLGGHQGIAETPKGRILHDNKPHNLLTTIVALTWGLPALYASPEWPTTWPQLPISWRTSLTCQTQRPTCSCMRYDGSFASTSTSRPRVWPPGARDCFNMHAQTMGASGGDSSDTSSNRSWARGAMP